MPASSKRSRRIKARESDYKQTGVMRKAKKNKFDTSGETEEVVRDIGNRKKLHPNDLCNLQPKNLRQEEFLRLFYEGTPLLVASGSAGVGKSFLALYCALSEVLREDTPYDKVILIRSAVQTRDIGALPGEASGEDSKASPFEDIYHGICQDILPKFNDGYKHLKSLGYLEFHLTSFLRGATFDRAIIIVDESAACNYHELSTATSRVGLNSRLIICGDTKQDDLESKGKKSDKSGFGHYLKVVEKMPASMTGVVHFTVDDIVRSSLVKSFLIADAEASSN